MTFVDAIYVASVVEKVFLDEVECSFPKEEALLKSKIRPDPGVLW